MLTPIEIAGLFAALLSLALNFFLLFIGLPSKEADKKKMENKLQGAAAFALALKKLTLLSFL